jgi:AcrR family transcriptional regulator
MTERAKDTRADIVGAFNRLVLSTRDARPPVAALLQEAGVARSTLYKHFDDKDSLLLEAMRGPLSVLAAAIDEAADVDRLTALLQHFWDRRRQATDLMSEPFSIRLVRALADTLAARHKDLDRSDILRVADSQLSLIRLWLSGETPCSAPVLAAKMIAIASAQRNALRRT